MSAEGQQEPSMEDILASIRKILSEDDGEAAKPEPAKAAPPPPPPPPPEPEPEPEPEPAPMPEPEPEPMPEPEPEPEPMMAEPEEPVASIFDPEPEEEPAFNPEPDMPLELTDSMIVEDQQPQHDDYYQPEPAPSFGQQHYEPNYGQHLVSDPVAEASGASISQLAQAVARERAVALGNHGLTLEQLVREICTPILKHWLDTNLPYMVERIVKQEIERIVTRSDRM